MVNNGMSLEEKLRIISEGAVDDIEDILDYPDDEGGDDIGDLGDIDFDDLDDDILSETTLYIIETEIGIENVPNYLKENSNMLVRDGLLTESTIARVLTEDAVGQSYIVLSPQARRQRAINILKLRMARNVGDPSYKKLVVARQLVKNLLEKIRSNPNYKKAEQIVRKMKFKVVQNPEAVAAMKKMKATKLQN